jgi:endonuclease/exonuclease/phosphatase family metal-dependent hydrolase
MTQFMRRSEQQHIQRRFFMFSHHMASRLRQWLIPVCALSTVLLVQHSQAGLFGFGNSGNSKPSAGLTLASWNLEWLMTPRTREELNSRCTGQQPASDERALPCAKGKQDTPARTPADFDALARSAAQLHGEHHVDVVALQEVDGAEAARQVFTQGWKLDCFVRRAHPQKVGFAIREGVPYRCNGDFQALDIDGSTRSGADITLHPGTPHETRLLSVHLKSGCFDGRLDRSFNPCEKLRRQVPVLESWIDQRVREGVAFAVMGDFNRRLDKDARYPAGPDESAPLNMVQAWSDDQPRGAILHRATDGQRYQPCDSHDHHKAYIDDILIDDKLASRNGNRRFTRLPYGPAESDRQLSDHCPVIWALKP